MVKENLFQIGREVTGASFIGRSDILRDLSDRFISSQTSRSVSLVGLARVGKSSLISNVMDFCIIREKGIIYIRVVLTESEHYVAFWKNIIAELETELLYYGISNPLLDSMIERVQSCPNNDMGYEKIRTPVKKIFKHLNGINKRTILVIDEFDGARTLFGGHQQYFEFLRTICSSAESLVSSILISRRNLHIIEMCTPENSTFHGVFEYLTLNGFNDDDMEAYYEALRDYDIILDDEQKEILHYYCGRLPYLLSIFGFYLVQSKQLNNQGLQIEDIFKEHSPQIIKYYEDIKKQLEYDNYIDKLLGIIIGPQLYLTQNDVAILNAMGLLNHNGGRYYSVCPHFTDYLRNFKHSFPIWDSIIQTEKLLKRVVDTEMPRALGKPPQTWQNDFFESLVRDPMKARKFSIFTETVERFKNSTRRDFNVDASMLDVISLTSIAKIIKHYWDRVFSRYFRNESFSSWADKLDLVALARNPLAHGQEEYLSETQKRLVEVYCAKIMEAINSVLSN